MAETRPSNMTDRIAAMQDFKLYQASFTGREASRTTSGSCAKSRR